MSLVPTARFSEAEKDDAVSTYQAVSGHKSKQVVMDQQRLSISAERHQTREERMLQDIQRMLDHRDQFKIIKTFNNELVNVTPKQINVPYDTQGYKKLTLKYAKMPFDDDTMSISFKSINSSVLRGKSSKGVGFRVSMEDIILGVGYDPAMSVVQPDIISISIMAVPSSSTSSLTQIEEPAGSVRHALPFVRINLCKTELVLIYEQHSMTAIKYTDDGYAADIDNKRYDYLTIGRGKIRRRSDGETQTSETLFKSRGVNTTKVTTTDTASYVSYFEMYDTYKALKEKNEDVDMDKKKLHFSQSKTSEEQFEMIHRLPAFHLASVIMKRVLASNTYEQGQRRYRNMSKPSRLMDKVNYKYTINRLFVMNLTAKDNVRKAVSDMSFCFTNSDILAVSYGIYSYQAAKLPTTGEVCVWSIKNPCDPERSYFYNVPVLSVQFSPYLPTLLAIGLYDGSVEVRDISNYHQPPVAVSTRASSPGVSPVLAIKWVKQTSSNAQNGIDPILTLSQDGSATQFHVINSPYLAGIKVMALERIEGVPEGLPVKYNSDITQNTNRCAQGINLTKHPVHPDIYYILTDEGCVHKCSTNCLLSYLEVLKTHNSAVNSMDFSPWSPKLFLTCGNDWCIRIWMEGIFQPLITLKNNFMPYHWARWSRTHSTVIMAINRKHCEIWDIRRSILNPMSSTNFEQSYNTMGIFSRDGNSLAIGNQRGQVFINGIDDMPFPPYYQYDTLEKAIYKAVAHHPDLLIELKTVGYFGYPNKGFVWPP